MRLKLNSPTLSVTGRPNIVPPQTHAIGQVGLLKQTEQIADNATLYSEISLIFTYTVAVFAYQTGIALKIQHPKTTHFTFEAHKLYL